MDTPAFPSGSVERSSDSDLHRALIVDSSPEINQLLTNLFDHADWSIHFVSDNREALRAAKASPHDLIITGECTSAKQDIELLRQLRMVRPHTRLIILTDEFVPGDVLAAIRERAFSYFARPFSTEKLAEMIRIAMSEPQLDSPLRSLRRSDCQPLDSILPGSG